VHLPVLFSWAVPSHGSRHRLDVAGTAVVDLVQGEPELGAEGDHARVPGIHVARPVIGEHAPANPVPRLDQRNAEGRP